MFISILVAHLSRYSHDHSFEFFHYFVNSHAENWQKYLGQRKFREIWAVPPSSAVRPTGIYCVLLCTWSMVGQLVSHTRFLPARVPVLGIKNHFKVATDLCKEVFFPLMCPVHQAKLCVAPLLETKATRRVTEIKKITSSPLWADTLEN